MEYVFALQYKYAAYPWQTDQLYYLESKACEARKLAESTSTSWEWRVKRMTIR